MLKDIRAGGDSQDILNAAFMDSASQPFPESQPDGGPITGVFKPQEVGQIGLASVVPSSAEHVQLQPTVDFSSQAENELREAVLPIAFPAGPCQSWGWLQCT